MKICGNCLAPLYQDDAAHCVVCGIWLGNGNACDGTARLPSSPARHAASTPPPDCAPNTCTNPDCPRHQTSHAFPDYAAYCAACGCKTTYKARRGDDCAYAESQ